MADGKTFKTFATPLTGNKIVLFITSLWTRSYSSKPVQFHISTEITNSSYFMWNATIWQYSMITNLHYSLVIFNSDDVQAS